MNRREFFKTIGLGALLARTGRLASKRRGDLQVVTDKLTNLQFLQHDWYDPKTGLLHRRVELIPTVYGVRRGNGRALVRIAF